MKKAKIRYQLSPGSEPVEIKDIEAHRVRETKPYMDLLPINIKGRKVIICMEEIKTCTIPLSKDFLLKNQPE